MHPLRILILLGLLYLLYRLLTAGRRRPPSAAGGAGTPVSHDVLVEDPVCHTYVPKGQALVLRQGDEARYFCSEKCREAFRAQQGEDA